MPCLRDIIVDKRVKYIENKFPGCYIGPHPASSPYVEYLPVTVNGISTHMDCIVHSRNFVTTDLHRILGAAKYGQEQVASVTIMCPIEAKDDAIRLKDTFNSKFDLAVVVAFYTNDGTITEE